MIGGSGGTDLSKYLINFNSSDWANKANAHLQQALNQALPYGEKYTQQAVNAVQDYNKQAQNQITQGYQQAQALNAPQHLATYNALDAYQQSLGLPTPAGGSFQLAQNMNNQASGQPVANPGMVAGYNQGNQTPVNNPPTGVLEGVQPAAPHAYIPHQYTGGQ